MRSPLFFVLCAASCAAFFAVESCAAPTLHDATLAMLSSADTGYGLAIAICDTKEKAIIARTDSTEIADRAALAQVRASCDAIYGVFEQIRRTDLIGAADVLEPRK